ncbi:helix-turn-helix domain-containing protein [Streptomyces sp. NPDC005963]|uniref:IclR family transcriptional regulator n=1 Tax=Streptomyces sp. NPDC005963 TaxID=3156721 RepID=UPI0033C9F485
MAATGDALRPTRGRGVVEGAFALLEALRRHGQGAGVTELAWECRVPKSTAHRLLDQLIAVGAVERHGDRYRVGSQLYRIGHAWQPHPGLRLAARLPLHRLRAATGASAVLTVLRDDLALTVSSIPGEVEPLVPVRDGMSFPLDTAAGRALRSGGARPQAALDREDVVPGVCCAALPVRSPEGRTVAALAAMVPVGRRLEAVTQAVAEAGAAITRGLALGAGASVELPPVLLH